MDASWEPASGLFTACFILSGCELHDFVLRGANGEYGNLYTYLLSTCDDKRGSASGDCGEIIYSDRGSLKTDSLNLYLQASRE